MRTAAHLLGLIDAASEPLAARHAVEVAELDERIKAYGERGSGKKQLDERHKRELRRYRTDELRSGLAAMAATYRDTAVNPATTDVEACAEAVRRIHQAIEMLDRNPNEKLLVESLLWSLPDAQGVTPVARHRASTSVVFPNALIFLSRGHRPWYERCPVGLLHGIPLRGKGTPCSNASPTGLGESSCSRRRRLASSTTATSAPSTSCSG